VNILYFIKNLESKERHTTCRPLRILARVSLYALLLLLHYNFCQRSRFLFPSWRTILWTRVTDWTVIGKLRNSTRLVNKY